MKPCGPLGDGLYEVPTGLSQNRIARVLFYIDRKGRLVLLHAFIKKIRKTPDEELRLARNNKSKHEKRLAMKIKTKGAKNVFNHSGSSFDSFLQEEGIRDEVEAVAIKRVLAWQLEHAMKEQQKTKQAMARELHTSRSQLDRLLDPRNVSVSLDTMARAAKALGKSLVIRITDAST